MVLQILHCRVRVGHHVRCRHQAAIILRTVTVTNHCYINNNKHKRVSSCFRDSVVLLREGGRES